MSTVIPDMNKFNRLSRLLVQRYESYLPTAFDESLTLLQKVNKVINYLNEVGDLNNDLLDEWAKTVDWITGDGVNTSVRDKLNEWLEDGTIDTVINQQIFEEFSGALEQLKNINNTLEINVMYPPAPYVGVKNDGTDQSAEIQALFDIALERPIKLFFPDGDYGIGTHLFWRGNTEITLSQNATLKRLGSINKLLQNGEQGNYNYSYGFSGDGNLTLRGGKIDLNSLAYPLDDESSITCINIGHAQNVLVEKVEITNGQNGHYFQLASSKDITIRDCKFTNQRLTGTSNIYEVIQIEVMSPESFPSFGGYDSTPSMNITIENNVFENCVRGIGTHGDGLYGTPNIIYIDNVRILNNTFKNMKSNPIGLVGFRNPVIENNSIDGSQLYGIWLRNCDQVKMNNNSVKNVSRSGLLMETVSNSVFRDNEFIEISLDTNLGWAAIRCTTVTDTVFDNNKVFSQNPRYTYAHWMTDGSLGNKVITHRYRDGQYGGLGLNDGVQLANLVTGNGRAVLFEGDLYQAEQTGILDKDIRLFSAIVIVANNNDGEGLLVSQIIPKDMYNFSQTAGRFRIVTATADQPFQIDFSMPNSTTLRIDNVSGNGHIRKVIGMV